VLAYQELPALTALHEYDSSVDGGACEEDDHEDAILTERDIVGALQDAVCEDGEDGARDEEEELCASSALLTWEPAAVAAALLTWEPAAEAAGAGAAAQCEEAPCEAPEAAAPREALAVPIGAAPSLAPLAASAAPAPLPGASPPAAPLPDAAALGSELARVSAAAARHRLGAWGLQSGAGALGAAPPAALALAVAGAAALAALGEEARHAVPRHAVSCAPMLQSSRVLGRVDSARDRRVTCAAPRGRRRSASRGWRPGCARSRTRSARPSPPRARAPRWAAYAAVPLMKPAAALCALGVRSVLALCATPRVAAGARAP
jgi:hypothetical protein